MRLARSLKSRRQAGDTVVEVMIAIAVIASILTGAFLVARNSSQNVRAAEEHSQALNLLQGQLEQLRASAADKANKTALTGAGAFCFTGGTINNAAAADCLKQDLYHISIKQTGHDSTLDTYTFQATSTWDRLGGGTNQVQLIYKVKIAS